MRKLNMKFQWIVCSIVLGLSYSAGAAGVGDPLKGKTTAETVCVACHNADGNSTIAANPILAGQIPEYLMKQLHDFKSKDGKPAARNNAVMAGMVAPLSEDDIKNVAAWFASQKMKPMAAQDAKQVEVAQRLWRMGDFDRRIPACAGCHGPAGAGLPVQYPRIYGQHQAYTEAQLKTFRTGERANDDNAMMRSIAAKLSDVEIKALADYVAGLRH